MLMDFVLGGKLWSVLDNENSTLYVDGIGGMKQDHARFYASNVVLALDYLHDNLNMVYRDQLRRFYRLMDSYQLRRDGHES